MTSAHFLKKCLNDINEFKGCFNITKIKQLRHLITFPSQFPSSFILLEKGHWTAIKILNKKTILYFNSFGEGIRNKKLLNLLIWNNYKSIYYSHWKIQSDQSHQCGVFCILFIKCVSNKVNYRDFLNLFYKRKLYKNDFIVNALSFV